MPLSVQIRRFLKKKSSVFMENAGKIKVFFKPCKSMLNLIGECHSLSYDALTAHVAIDPIYVTCNGATPKGSPHFTIFLIIFHSQIELYTENVLLSQTNDMSQRRNILCLLINAYQYALLLFYHHVFLLFLEKNKFYLALFYQYYIF